MALKRKRAWTSDEDKILRIYVNNHGTGHWDTVATNLGTRTGNSCRLRWLNYLCPDIRLEDFSNEEMLMILNLRFQKNGWAKIAKMLPAGRSDNHVKNFWNTRMKKEAKLLNCEVTSQEFLNKMTQSLTDRIQAPDNHADTMVIGGETTAATMVTGDFPVISWSAHQELISDYDSIPHEFWFTLPSICPL